ncbi:hypothetical protein [Microbacterium aurugineum]
MNPLLEFVGDERVERVIHLLRLASAIPLLLPSAPRPLKGIADSALAVASMALAPKHLYGSDGSDQLSLLTQALCAIARFSPRSAPAIVEVLALQAALSYGVAGVGKLAGRAWRDGTALETVLSTVTLGNRRAHAILAARPQLSKVLTWSVVGAECVAPLALILPARLGRVVTMALAGFHVINSFALGLNRFTPAFLALHPSMRHYAQTRKTGAL